MYTDIGTTEVTGGTYARQAITWTAAAAGLRDNNAQISIPVPAGVTVQSLGFHSAVSAGTPYGYFPVGSAGQVAQGVGTASVAGLITSNGHGLTTDDRVFVWAANNEALPTGFALLTLYFVKSVGLTTDAFSLATTSGGAAVGSAVGELWFAKTVPNTWASAGNFVIATGALDFDLLRA